MEPNEDNIPKRAPYPLVEPDIRSWPIYKLSRNKKELIEAVIAESLAKLHRPEKGADVDLVAEAYYQERIRMKEEPWKVDPPDEGAFFKKLKHDLQVHAADKSQVPENSPNELLERLVSRYAHEIVGDFRMNAYKFARGMVNFGFSRVFNTFTKGIFRSIRAQQKQLVNKMQITGEVDAIRRASKQGTVVLVPTHFSNLDSIVIGWALHTMGLPPFTYGAGINLFGHPVLSYFMTRLGAYRVDRRKKSHIYLTVLKTYAEHIVRQGAHTLFFPGGTRSRSGAIESRLKLGLLGTVLEAQRKLVLENPENPKRIFIAPLVMSYHNVLEAQNLIDESLKREGRERYVLLKDDFQSLRKNIGFIWNFMKGSSEMVFSFGEPRDLFGNRLDEEGRSISKNGKLIDIGDYFRTNGQITYDDQRNRAYTTLLGERILESYYKLNIVFNSHLVSFAAFEYLVQTRNIDVYQLFTSSEEGMLIPGELFKDVVAKLLEKLRQMQQRGLVKLAQHLDKDTETVIAEGIANLGGFHVEKPLGRHENGDIYTENLKLLFFYHNRLKGYELHRFIF